MFSKQMRINIFLSPLVCKEFCESKLCFLSWLGSTDTICSGFSGLSRKATDHSGVLTGVLASGRGGMSSSGYKEPFIVTLMEKKLLEKKVPGPKGPSGTQKSAGISWWTLALLTALIPGHFQPHTISESTILREAIHEEKGDFLGWRDT
jgi:hypothetical protein